MRYYTIKILDPATGQPFLRSDGTPYVWSSIGSDGNTLLGALNIELDIFTVSFDTPCGSSFLRIWGISIVDIGQAADLNGKMIQIYAGMTHGLPLANVEAPFAGLIAQGTIQQAFGNWQGVDMTLDMQLQPPVGSPDNPVNATFQWTAGQSLSSAIAATLKSAVPGTTATININPNLVVPNTVTGVYQSLTQFSQWLRDYTTAIIGGTYSGVRIVLKQNEFVVYDGSSPDDPIQISFFDLIGQPTWFDSYQVSIKLVMRSDIQVTSFIKLPPTPVITTFGALSQYRQKSIFQGSFGVTQVRHVGNFRQPDANAWVTNLIAYSTS